jgi:DNA-binding NtrC family response regulator
MNSSQPNDLASSDRSRWILVVDDEVPMLDMMEAMLTMSGWTARTAKSGEEAMAVIESMDTPPALLICDIWMPKPDGVEITRQIVARVKNIKVVLISGRLTQPSWCPPDFVHYRFLAKPFSIDELQTAVKEAFAEMEAGH